MRSTPSATEYLAFSAADTARGSDGAVAEIVTFRLIDGANPSDFAAAADGMAAILNDTGAVLSRTLSVDEAGLWTDHLTWTSMSAAKAAAEAMMTNPSAAPFMQHIDPDTVVLRHANIRYTIQKE